MSHATIILKKKVLEGLFSSARDNFRLEAADEKQLGRFGGFYDIDFTFREGEGVLIMRDDGTIQVKELDVKWRKLIFGFTVDIPKITVGGFCIIPTPWGCALRAPKATLFDKNPDVRVPIDLSVGGLLRSEVSVRGTPYYKHKTDDPKKWQMFLELETVDVDFVDVAAVIRDHIVNGFIDVALSIVPEVLRPIVGVILGGLAAFIEGILDLGDDIGEWISDTLGISLGLIDTIITALGNYFREEAALHELDDPYEIMKEDTDEGLPAVRIPIADLAVLVDSEKLTLTADVGV